MHIPKSVIMANNVPFYEGDIVDYIYGKQKIERINQLTDLHPVRVTDSNISQLMTDLSDVEIIFSCWGMPKLSDADLEQLPNLKLVLYAGGSTAGFADPFLKRGVTICSAVEANAIPVAEFCLAQILLSCKGAYRNSQLCNNGPWNQNAMPVGKGVYGETIALLGIGAISRHLLKLLKPFSLKIIAVSGYLSKNPEEAKALGIDRLVSIEEAFKEGYIVSNHLPSKPDNKGIIKGSHFSSMRHGATFINTGRGAQVTEAEMISILMKRTDLTALLDVQHPEPPDENSELFALPNVHMTSHIAGSSNDEVRRMADFMLQDLERYINGVPLEYAIDSDYTSKRA